MNRRSFLSMVPAAPLAVPALASPANGQDLPHITVDALDTDVLDTADRLLSGTMVKLQELAERKGDGGR